LKQNSQEGDQEDSDLLDNQHRNLRNEYYNTEEKLEETVITKNIKRTKKQKSTVKKIWKKELEIENQKAKINLLKKIFERNLNNDISWNKNLYRILTNTGLIWSAQEKLKSNEGAMTPGVDQKNPDELGLEEISNISEKLKTKKYRFQPVKRTYVKKPGKETLRPLGIPTYEDKIVQELMRIVLSTIYEPEFLKENYNYGFRPKLSTTDAILKIAKQGRGMTYAIEGDIKGAYDNVDHDILIEILKQKIKDVKFIGLIKNLLKSGLEFKGTYQHTFLGVPQGGIVSPLLFNIYMHEFDKHITEWVRNLFEEKNRIENRTENARAKLSEKWRSRVRECINSIKKIRKNRKYSELTELEKQKYKKKRKELRIRIRIQRKTKSTSQKRTKLRFSYVRYADDWILLNNADKKTNELIKKHISEWLQENLKLTLSEEKTHVTDIKKKKAKFLGFTIRNTQKFRIFNTYELKNPKLNLNKKTMKKRTTTDLFIGIDNERIINRLKTKGFLTEKGKPRRHNLYINLTPWEIVFKYKQITEGLMQYYYRALTYKSQLTRYHYYLTYSCYHTLANRQKSTISKIINKYGKEVKMTIPMEKTKGITTEMDVKLKSYIRMMSQTMIRTSKKLKMNKDGEIVYKIPEITDLVNGDYQIEDFITVKANLRTYIKLKKYCSICGASKTIGNRIESHHVNAIRKGKEIGFTKNVMRQLGKKQIIICQKCHQRIHRGQYDGITLEDFYDPELAKF